MRRLVHRLLKCALYTLLLAAWGAPALSADWLDWLGSGAILELDGSVVVAGNPDGEPAGARTSLYSGDHTDQQLRIRVASTDWAAVSLAEVVLSTSGNFDEYFQADLRAMLSAPTPGEWIDLTVPAGAWNASDGADWATVNALLLRVSSTPGKTGMVGFGGIAFMDEPAQAGVVTIAFDDGRSDVYDYAWPELRRRGLTGTVFVIPELVGTDGYMTLEQLRELQLAGWEIAGHGEYPLVWLSDAELSRHLQFAGDWLRDNGFGNRPGYAYPNGQFNTRVVQAVRRHFKTGRTINAHSEVLGHAEAYALGGVSVYPGMLQEELEDLAAAAADGGEWLTIVFHLFADTPQVDTQFPPERFEELLDFLVEHDVTVLTSAAAWELNRQLSP